jgi:hypothetical protein
MQQRALFSMRRRLPGELEMHFSLPCWQLFATMARAIEWQ